MAICKCLINRGNLPPLTTRNPKNSSSSRVETIQLSRDKTNKQAVIRSSMLHHTSMPLPPLQVCVTSYHEYQGQQRGAISQVQAIQPSKESGLMAKMKQTRVRLKSNANLWSQTAHHQHSQPLPRLNTRTFIRKPCLPLRRIQTCNSCQQTMTLQINTPLYNNLEPQQPCEQIKPTIVNCSKTFSDSQSRLLKRTETVHMVLGF